MISTSPKFLNNQNISDVAELVYEFPEEELNIISQLSIHRASSVFKILDFAEQKSIISKWFVFLTVGEIFFYNGFKVALSSTVAR